MGSNKNIANQYLAKPLTARAVLGKGYSSNNLLKQRDIINKEKTKVEDMEAKKKMMKNKIISINDKSKCIETLAEGNNLKLKNAVFSNYHSVYPKTSRCLNEGANKIAKKLAGASQRRDYCETVLTSKSNYNDQYSKLADKTAEILTFKVPEKKHIFHKPNYSIAGPQVVFPKISETKENKQSKKETSTKNNKAQYIRKDFTENNIKQKSRLV